MRRTMMCCAMLCRAVLCHAVLRCCLPRNPFHPLTLCYSLRHRKPALPSPCRLSHTCCPPVAHLACHALMPVPACPRACRRGEP